MTCSMPTCGLLLSVLFANGALGSLDSAFKGIRSSEQDRASAVADHLSSFETICDKAEIWTLLTADSSVDGIRNIKWAKINSIVDHQLQSYGQSIQVLQSKLEGLRKRIQDAERHEARKVVTEADVDALLLKGVGGVFGGVEKAKSAQCGKPGVPRDVAVRGGFNRCARGFQAVAEDFFAREEWRFGDAHLFLSRCAARLGGAGYCPELCQRLQTVLVRASEAHGMHHGTTSELLRVEEHRALEELAAAGEGRNRCSQAQESLSDFAASLESRAEVADVRHEELREAEHALEDARYDLEDLDLALLEEAGHLEDTLKALSADDTAVEAAKASLESLQTQEGDLKGKVAASSAALSTAQEKLRAAKVADEVIEKLRDAVSATTLKMRQYYTAGALEPALDKLSTKTDLDQYFYATLSEVPGAGAMSGAVDGLDAFCREEALPAFKAVKSVDLTSLCAIGAVDAIKEGLHKSVAGTVGRVRGAIEDVKSWMQPYKGQDSITQEVAEKLVASGEPKGLREIITVYEHATFYQYLQGWKYRGAFLAKIALLRDARQALTQALDQLTAELAALKDQYAKAMAAREDAQRQLEAASRAQGLSQAQKAKLEESVAAMNEQSEKMKRSLAALEEQVRIAMARYEEAKEQLEAAHAEGTKAQADLDQTLSAAGSFLQAQSEEDAQLKYAELTHMLQAKRERFLLQNELDAARSEHEALQEQILDLKSL